MKKIIYTKYNQTRSPKYRTKTCIVEENNTRYITKEALGEEAREHVTAFPQKFEQTKGLFAKIDFLPVEMNGEQAGYPFLEGNTLDEQIQPLVEYKDRLLKKIHELLDNYYIYNDSCFCAWESNSIFTELFGNIDCTGEECIRPANLDVIFDNIIVDKAGNATAYDYEWTYDIAVPKQYILFRIISRIYDKYLGEISAYMDFEPFAAEFGIDEEYFEKYLNMEGHFLHEIYGEGEPVLTRADIYPKTETLHELRTSKIVLEQEKQRWDQELTALRNEVEFLKGEVKNREIRLKEAEDKYGDVYFELEALKNSASWKITGPLRKGKHIAKKVKQYGVKESLNRVMVRSNLKEAIYDTYRSEDRLAYERSVKFKANVKISVVTPLFNTPLNFLKELLDSIQAQTYENWELCLVDFSGDDHPEVGKTALEYAAKDSRIRYKRDPENKGIAENTNTCIAMSTGDYIGILDHDDVLHPSAFFEVMEKINQGSDFIYTDEAKFSTDIRHLEIPNYKPDFAQDELLAHNYICHLNIFKKSLLDQVGGYRPEFDGSQDHDIVLRLTEVAENITHIPHVLYYWRVHAASVAADINAKPYATISGIKAVEEAYKRRGFNYRAQSIIGNIPTYKLVVPEDTDGTIRLIVWGKNAGKRKNVISMIENGWNNISEIQEFETLHKALKAVKTVKNETCLFVYEGVEIPQVKESIQVMLLQAALTDVAAVDSKLIYPDLKIFSAGMIEGRNLKNSVGFRGHGMSADFGGYENNFVHARNVSGVSLCFTIVNANAWNKGMESGVYHRNMRMIWESNAMAVVPRELTEQNIITAQKSIIDIEGLPSEDAYYNPGIREFGLESS